MHRPGCSARLKQNIASYWTYASGLEKLRPLLQNALGCVISWRNVPARWHCDALIVREIALAYFSVSELQNIVDSVVRSYGTEVSEPAQEKLFNYLRLLASTGITDEKLLTFGRAYLRELLKPDPRYTGC